MRASRAPCSEQLSATWSNLQEVTYCQGASRKPWLPCAELSAGPLLPYTNGANTTARPSGSRNVTPPGRCPIPVLVDVTLHPGGVQRSLGRRGLRTAAPRSKRASGRSPTGAAVRCTRRDERGARFGGPFGYQTAPNPRQSRPIRSVGKPLVMRISGVRCRAPRRHNLDLGDLRATLAADSLEAVTNWLPEPPVIARDPQPSTPLRIRMHSGNTGPSHCLPAEGRGFESHQPLEETLQSRGFFVSGV
jgi:hypothetical protein